MNNLKVLNPVPNGVQGSSEDPPGFIYPTYQAAPTQAHSDKPSLNRSYEGVAYVTSSVGGSVSTLSFEDNCIETRATPHTNYGRALSGEG